MSEPETSNSPVARGVVTPKHAATVHLAITNADFVLVFAILKPFWEAQQGLVPGMSLEEVATISLSPITAKQLLRQLTRAIDGFEAVTGVVIPEMGEIAGEGLAMGQSGTVG